LLVYIFKALRAKEVTDFLAPPTGGGANQKVFACLSDIEEYSQSPLALILPSTAKKQIDMMSPDLPGGKMLLFTRRMS
jgi:hypothetical protein